MSLYFLRIGTLDYAGREEFRWREEPYNNKVQYTKLMINMVGQQNSYRIETITNLIFVFLRLFFVMFLVTLPTPPVHYTHTHTYKEQGCQSKYIYIYMGVCVVELDVGGGGGGVVGRGTKHHTELKL